MALTELLDHESSPGAPREDLAAKFGVQGFLPSSLAYPTILSIVAL